MARKNITRGEQIYIRVNYVLLSLFALFILVPLLSVFITSFVSANEIARRGEFILWPEKFDFNAYKLVFMSSNIWRGYQNTLFVVVVGTALSLTATILLAYPLSKKQMRGRTAILGFIFFTMLFSGGTVPTYLTVKAVGLINSRWALIIPSLVSAWNLLLMRNFFYTIPDSIEEASYLDGANQFQILIYVILPLSLPSIATIGMFYAVGYWNAWWPGVIYLNSTEHQPVQNVMRTIVMAATAAQADFDVVSFSDDARLPPSQSLKNATIIISTIPILLVYPLVQKHFVQGTLAGSVKG